MSFKDDVLNKIKLKDVTGCPVCYKEKNLPVGHDCEQGWKYYETLGFKMSYNDRINQCIFHLIRQNLKE
jgi:hypothetical protein